MTTNQDLVSLIRRLYEISSPEGRNVLDKILQEIDLRLTAMQVTLGNEVDSQDKSIPSLLDEGEKNE